MSKRWLLTIFSIMLAAALLFVGWGVTLLIQQSNTALVARVIDGDTIELADGQRVRYIGIDTPEKGDYYFDQATAMNSALVLGREVRLEKDVSETDKYGRLLRYVYVGDLFVNVELVRLGYAQAVGYPPDTKYLEEFLKLEKYAKSSNLGLHGEPEIESRPKLQRRELDLSRFGFKSFLSNNGGTSPKSKFKSFLQN